MSSIDSWESLADSDEEVSFIAPILPIIPIAPPPTKINAEIQKPRIIKSPSQKELIDKINLSHRQFKIMQKAIRRIGHRGWKLIASSAGISETNLYRHFVDTGKGINSTTSIQINCCGQERYLELRKKLIEKLISSRKTNFFVNCSLIILPSKLKLNSKEKIIHANIITKINEEYIKLIEDYDRNIYRFTYRFIEINVLSLLLNCENMMKSENDMTELIVGYKKFYNEKINNDKISPQCLDDLKFMIEKAEKMVKFKFENVVNNHPRYIFHTAYDSLLDGKRISMTQSQLDILEFVRSNNNQKYLGLVHSMLGSGKTTAVLAICGYLMAQTDKVKNKVIYCCPNVSVIYDVARMAFSMTIPFGFIIFNGDNQLEFKWSDHAGKKNQEANSVLYLCDIYVCKLFLQEKYQKKIQDYNAYIESHRTEPNNYPMTRAPKLPDDIFVGDEVTKDADSQENIDINTNFSLGTELFIEILRVCPNKIILMSATLPTYQQLPQLYDKVSQSKGSMIIKSFSSNEAKTGCSLISGSGNLYAPHDDCTTSTDIKQVLNVIKSNPFIGRFYTYHSMQKLHRKLETNDIKVNDLCKIFEDPSKATQYNIQCIAYDLLDTLSNQPDEKVKSICKTRAPSAPSLTCPPGQGNTNKIQDRKPIDLNKIFTHDIDSFNRTCMVFANDPMKLAIDLFRKNFEEFTEEKSDIFQQIKYENIMKDYQKDLEKYQQDIERLQRNLDDGSTKQNKLNQTKERDNVSKDEKLYNAKSNRPTWKFPGQFQLCSEKHLNMLNKADKKLAMSTMIADDMPEQTSVPLEVLILLACGIGIYTENSLLDSQYLNTVLYLAKKGFLKFIFTDSAMAYGTNLSVSNVVIVDSEAHSIIDHCSMKTIFQMLGRAGRGSHLNSYEAIIHTTSSDDRLINNIKLYIRGQLDEGNRDEIINIRNAVDLLLD